MLQAPQARPLAEAARLARGLGGLPSAFFRARRVGHDETVLVIPGFATGDTATIALRTYLRRCGYQVEGWQLGINGGQVRALTPKVADRIRALFERKKERIKLVGWSLGGVLAREATRLAPDAVDCIVTLGTPVIGGPKYTLVANRYEAQGIDLDAIEARAAEANREPLPVPITAIYSRTDGIVAWKACFDDNPANDIEYIEVKTGHAELGFSGPAFRAVTRGLHKTRQK